MTKFFPQRDIAVGPDRAGVRVWRSWGERAMPMSMRRSHDKPSRWIFRERARPAPEVPLKFAQDGRPTLDDGFVESADRLLDRLREVHGGQGRRTS